MKPEARKPLEKATRALRAAERLARDGDLDFEAGRAYYAMFYGAEALLLAKDMTFRKHGGVHAAFGEHYAKTGLVDAKFHRWMLDAFDKRLEGDYGFEADLTVEEVTEMIEQARDFLGVAREYLERNA